MDNELNRSKFLARRICSNPLFSDGAPGRFTMLIFDLEDSNSRAICQPLRLATMGSDLGTSSFSDDHLEMPY